MTNTCKSFRAPFFFFFCYMCEMCDSCSCAHPTLSLSSLSLGNSADKAEIWWMSEDIEFPNKADVELNPGVRKQPPASAATGWRCFVGFHLHWNFTFWLILSKHEKAVCEDME